MSVIVESPPEPAASVAGRLLANSVWVAASDLMWRMASVVLFSLVAHNLGEVAAGRYTVTMTVTMLAFSLSVWGLDQLLIRDVAQRPEEARSYFSQFFLLRVAFSLAAIALLALATRVLLPYPAATEALILLFAWSLLPDGISDLCQALFMGLERMYYLPLTSVLTGIVRVAVAGGVLLLGGSLAGAFWALLLVSVLRAALSMAIALRLVGGIEWGWRGAFLKESLATSVPFFFINIFISAEGMIGVLLLSALAGEAATGFYGAANTVLTGLALLPAAFRAAVFPVMSRTFKESQPRFARLYYRSYLYLVAAVAPLVVTVIALAPWIMQLVGGAAFRDQWPVLAALIWVLPLNFLTVPNSRYMIITRRQHILAWVLGAAVLLNVAANLLFVPIYGAAGAAIARVLSFGSFFVLVYYYLDRREMRINLLSILARPLLAGAVMALLVAWLGVPRGLLPGWIAYLVLWSALGGLPPEERLALRDALRRRSGL